MPLPRRTLLIAAAALALTILAGAIYFFFIRTQTVSLNSYVCQDGSYYFVAQDRDAIEVAGKRYELASEADGKRYEGEGPLAYTIRGTEITASMKASGEVLASCSIGHIESAPIVDEVTP